MIILTHAHVADHGDRPWALDEGNNDVHTAFEDPVERPQALNHHYLRLADNDQTLGNDENANGDYDQTDNQSG